MSDSLVVLHQKRKSIDKQPEDIRGNGDIAFTMASLTLLSMFMVITPQSLKLGRYIKNITIERRRMKNSWLVKGIPMDPLA
jgi:hypothetical protein